MRARAASGRGGLLLLSLLASTAWAQSGSLLVAGAVTERAEHMDLAIEFACSLPYRSHTPAAEGDHVRVVLAIGADCAVRDGAQFPTGFIRPADAAGLVRSIELQPGLAGGAELVVNWNRIERFVLAPAAGMRGLRIRVQRGSPAQVTIGEAKDPTADYAVNLASSQQPFTETDAGSAAALLQTAVYVSEVEVAGVRWYRLRAGPFGSRREADAALRLALPRYPAAWLAIGDEAEAVPREQAARIVTPGPAGAPESRADPALDQQLESARAALADRQFDAAIRSLTPLAAAAGYRGRREATELLGLANERRGYLAQAKSAYEEYLRRYPDSPAAERVRARLQALRLTDVPGRNRSRGAADRRGWTATAHAAQSYRRDDTHLSTSGLSRDLVTQNAVLTDLDGLLRRRGERFDFIGRTSLGYMKDLQPAGRENRLRVTSAYAEFSDRSLGRGARLGRQSRGMAGINGLFDGLLANARITPRLGASLAAGAPVDNTRSAPDFDRWFMGGALDLATPARSWETSAFMLAQQYAGRTDRRSLGVEGRYLGVNRTLVAMTDYDVHFGELNSAMLLGTLITDSRWTFTVDAGLQRSPQLGLRNALIGQPTLAFDDLTLLFTDAEIEQLARDRSARLTRFSAGASHPAGERGQWSVNLSSFDLSGTPESGGVAAVPAPGREDTLSAELLVNSLLRAGDTHSFALRVQRGGNGRAFSAGVGSRLLLGAAWRLTSRLRLDRRDVQTDSSRNWLLAPSLRLEYQRGRANFELEAGVELARRHAAPDTDRTTRRFISAGYRLSFDQQP